MKALKERILRDGRCFPGGILKVDNFINHQMDPILMKSIGVEFVRRFASTDINKIITVEASGIAPAIMVGYLLELPVVFAKKKKPNQAGAELVGMGFIIEKAFQHGGDELRAEGIHVESLAIIESLDNCEIRIR